MVYAVFALLGAIIPLSPVLYFLATHSFDVTALVEQAIATPASLTAWLDVILTALALVTWLLWEGRSRAIKRLWLSALATVLIGPACGLPLFLYQRSRHSPPSNTPHQQPAIP